MENAHRATVAEVARNLAVGVAVGHALIGCGDSSMETSSRTVVLAQAQSCEARRSTELYGQIIQLWAPNHKFHSIAVGDCLHALANCNGELTGEFVWASSDEPIDDIGDGHHAPDIYREDSEHVCVRSERQGPKDGRVYRLGVRVVDTRDRDVEGECLVIVDHDQRGALARDSDDAYRLIFDAADDRADCDGPPRSPRTPAPEPPPRPAPPVPPDGERPD